MKTITKLYSFNCIRCIKFKLENKLKRTIKFLEIEEENLQYSSIIQNPPDIKDFFNESDKDDKVLRFCFAKTDDTLKRGAEILCNI